MKELGLESMEQISGGSHYASCTIEMGLQAAAIAGVSTWFLGGFWPAAVMGGWIAGAVVGAVSCYNKY